MKSVRTHNQPHRYDPCANTLTTQAAQPRQTALTVPLKKFTDSSFLPHRHVESRGTFQTSLSVTGYYIFVFETWLSANHFGPNRLSKHFGFIGQCISETVGKAVLKRAAKDSRKKQLLHQSADLSGPEHWILPCNTCEGFQYDIEQN